MTTRYHAHARRALVLTDPRRLDATIYYLCCLELALCIRLPCTIAL